MLGISLLGGKRNVSSRRRAMGKNLAIRFPADVAKSAGLGDGQRVEIVSHDNEVVIRKLPPAFTIDEMFRGKPPQDLA